MDVFVCLAMWPCNKGCDLCTVTAKTDSSWALQPLAQGGAGIENWKWIDDLFVWEEKQKFAAWLFYQSPLMKRQEQSAKSAMGSSFGSHLLDSDRTHLVVEDYWSSVDLKGWTLHK